MAVKSSFRNMTLCLLVICLVCSALLAGVYVLTEKPIAAAQTAKTTKAVTAVLPECDKLSERQSVDCEGASYNYYSADKDGVTVGYAIESATTGFGGTLSLMVGIAVDGRICGTSVLSHSETPGLGAKCTDPAFSGQFKGWDASAKKLAVRKDGGDVDAITASTITSRAYTLAVANAVKVFRTISSEAASQETVCENEGGQTNE